MNEVDYPSLMAALTGAEQAEKNRAAETLDRVLRTELLPRALGRFGRAADYREESNALILKILSAPDLYRDKHWGYLRTVAINARLTDLKKRKRELATEDLPLGLREAPLQADPVEFSQRWELLDQLHRLAVQARRQQDRAPLEASWPQLKALVEEHATFQEFVDEAMQHAAASTPPVKLGETSAQNRLYQAHKRCREALTRTLERLEVERGWPPDDLLLARRQLQSLLRAAPAQPTGKRRAVSGATDGGDLVSRKKPSP